LDQNTLVALRHCLFGLKSEGSGRPGRRASSASEFGLSRRAAPATLPLCRFQAAAEPLAPLLRFVGVKADLLNGWVTLLVSTSGP
jgi:hypothetical protein